jgi:hypothetical protein
MRQGAAAATAALILGTAAAHAADFPQRTELLQRSAAAGLGREQVTLLERQPGPGAAARLDELAARFSQSSQAVNTRGGAERLVKGRSAALRGDGWLLQVYADGSRARYRNYAALDAKGQSLARPLAERMTPTALETLGRRFIATQLSGLVALGEGEDLVPLYTEHEISTLEGVGSNAGQREEYVAASTVVFGRSVDGVAVVGPGSKVAVVFANDGEALGFDFDWPRYTQTARTQRVLSLPQIRARARTLTDVDLTAPDISLKRTECGYVDAGAGRRDPSAPLQAGCGLHYTRRIIVDAEVNRRDPASGHTLAAVAEEIPAGETVEPDANWPQAVRLAGGPEDAEPAPPTRR